MRACLFGTYDRAHSANRLLRMALAGAGFEVVELHRQPLLLTPLIVGVALPR